MIPKHIIERLATTDWHKYDGQKKPDDNHVREALEELICLENESLLYKVQDNLLFAIGNNHRGTYYPVTIQAIEFIIYVAIDSDSEVARYASLETLILIYYTFSAENECYDQLSVDQVENLVYTSIESFIHRFQHRLTDTFESERNKQTLSELVELIEKRTIV